VYARQEFRTDPFFQRFFAKAIERQQSVSDNALPDRHA
jgi:hypothetical protein